MDPLAPLFEIDGLPTYDLPEPLRRLYGGSLGFARPRVYANFVASLDGVVALEDEPHSSQLISGSSEADRFVMGLLRACADAVVIGAGTLRAAPDSVWTPAFIFPDAARDFAALRRDLGRPDPPAWSSSPPPASSTPTTRRSNPERSCSRRRREQRSSDHDCPRLPPFARLGTVERSTSPT